MKNIITNIIGFLIMASAVFGLLVLELELLSFSVLMAVGSCFFYFENETIKRYLKRAVNKYLRK